MHNVKKVKWLEEQEMQQAGNVKWGTAMVCGCGVGEGKMYNVQLGKGVKGNVQTAGRHTSARCKQGCLNVLVSVWGVVTK